MEKTNRPVPSIVPSNTPLRLPWRPSTFEGATEGRLNISFVTDPALLAWAQALDKWTVAYVTQHCERLLKKKLSEQQVREAYKSPLVQKGDYTPTLRAKITLGGANACRFWDVDGALLPAPEDWLVRAVPSLQLRHLWVMGGEFGWVIEARDIQLHEDAPECPFAAASPEIQMEA